MDTLLYNLKQYISTHALTWSATYELSFVGVPAQRFQLTRSRGARPLDEQSSLTSAEHFNSRAHVERDAAMT